jgi:excisionase family DNA binding protein
MPIDVASHALTPRELAARWRCRVKTVRAMIRRGELTAICLAGRVRILPEAIAAAEAGPLAVRPIRQKTETVPKEIAELLRD